MTAGRPNVVLLVLDTARAANLSVHGYEPTTTPNIERVAGNATVYENAITPSPWTLPAHASVLSGLYPSHHGTTRSNAQFAEEIEFLPEIFGKAGYETACISANKLLFQDPVLRDSFDRSVLTTRRFPTETPERGYVELREGYQGVNFQTLDEFLTFARVDDTSLLDVMNLFDRFWRNKVLDGKSIQSAAKNVAEFERVFDSSRDNFVLLNFMDTHLRYEPLDRFLEEVLPPKLAAEDLEDVNQNSRLYNYANEVSMSEKDFRRLQVLYDGAYRTVDHFVGQVYDYLVESGQFDNTLFVVLGDHGENLGENGKMGHSLSVSDYVCHVPLIVSYPQQRDGNRVDSLVQTHDVFRTVLKEVDVEPGDTVGDWRSDGTVLPRSETDQVRSYAVSEYLGSPFEGIQNIMEEYQDVDYSQYDFELKTIYDDEGHKYTTKSTREEWLLLPRRGERLSIDENSELVESMRTELYDRVAAFGQTKRTGHDRYIETTLKDLGYI